MEKLTRIATEYLKDFEILRDARLQLESELAAWWSVLLKDLTQHFTVKDKCKVHIWDNKSSPGLVQISAKQGRPTFVQITDPRHNGTRDFLLTVETTAATLKKIKADQTSVDAMNEIGKKHSLGEMFLDVRTIAKTPISIQPTAPSKTLKSIQNLAIKMFALVVAAEKATGGFQDQA